MVYTESAHTLPLLTATVGVASTVTVQVAALADTQPLELLPITVY